MQKCFLKPITDTNGMMVLVDVQGKKFQWPTNDSRNDRLCTAALKNANSVKVRLVNDQLMYGTAPLDKFVGKDATVSNFPILEKTQIIEHVEVDADQAVMMNFIHNDSYGLKPESLMVSELKWKYLIRSTMRGKNIMMTGPAGCGKTMAA